MNWQTQIIWRYCGVLALKLTRQWHTFQRRWWRIKFRLEIAESRSYFKMGTGVRFDTPVRVGGGRGTLEIGDGVGFGWPGAPRLGDGTILLEPRTSEAIIKIGADTMFSNNVSIIAMGSVSIVNHCLIGDLTTVFDCDFHELNPNQRMAGVGPIEPVTIGDNVWIGSRVLILRGVSIGDNAVIGAGSVVTKNIPANNIAAGVPARVIRSL